MAKKKSSRKSRDKEKYKAKYKFQQMSEAKKTKRKKSSNRAARIYQRKARVGNDPKKIFARIKHVFRRIFWDDLRCLVAKDIVEGGDLDDFKNHFRGTIKDDYETATDTVDLMVELVNLLKQNKLYFRPKYSQLVSLTFQDKEVEIPWPKTLDGDCAHSFTQEFILIHGGTLYHNHWFPVKVPDGFSYELVPIEEMTGHPQTTKFFELLDRFDLSFSDIKDDLAVKDKGHSDEELIVPRKPTKRSKLSKKRIQPIQKKTSFHDG